MTIKAIKEAYADYRKDFGKTMYKVYDFGGEYGKCVIICKNGGRDLKTVDQVVRVSDGKALLADHRWRWTDSLEDAVDVASEMLADNDDYTEASDADWFDDRLAEQAEPEQELTPKEIKAAFNTMKKELKKEFNDGLFDGGFVMNATQIAKRTATFTAGKAQTFDEEIAYITEHELPNVDRWYAPVHREEMRRHYTDRIQYLVELKAQYSTRLERVEAIRDMLKNSQAFSNFEKAVGRTNLSIEIDSDNYYKLRFAY